MLKIILISIIWISVIGLIAFNGELLMAKKIKSLDGLRFIWVITIVLSHFGFTNEGWVGGTKRISRTEGLVFTFFSYCQDLGLHTA